jgi:hypothetical protein
MTEIIIRPTGLVPYRFNGSETESWSCQYVQGRDRSRWHEITLYSIDNSDAEVLAISYRTTWAGEVSHTEVYLIEDELEIANSLQLYDPLKFLIGYPDGEAFRDKKIKQREEISRNWNSLKAEVYKSLEICTPLPQKNKSAQECDELESIIVLLRDEIMTEANKRQLPGIEVARQLLSFYETKGGTDALR